MLTHVLCALTFLQARDFTGAVTLLEFNRRSGEDDALEETLLWLGYCTFHLGSYQRAIDVFLVGGGSHRPVLIRPTNTTEFFKCSNKLTA